MIRDIYCERLNIKTVVVLNFSSSLNVFINDCYECVLGHHQTWDCAATAFFWTHHIVCSSASLATIPLRAPQMKSLKSSSHVQILVHALFLYNLLVPKPLLMYPSKSSFHCFLLSEVYGCLSAQLSVLRSLNVHFSCGMSHFHSSPTKFFKLLNQFI